MSDNKKSMVFSFDPFSAWSGWNPTLHRIETGRFRVWWDGCHAVRSENRAKGKDHGQEEAVTLDCVDFPCPWSLGGDMHVDGIVEYDSVERNGRDCHCRRREPGTDQRHALDRGAFERELRSTVFVVR
jgi:hypothetical protein